MPGETITVLMKIKGKLKGENMITDRELKFNEKIYTKMQDAKIEDERFVKFEAEHMTDIAAIIVQVNRYMEEKDQAVFDDDDTEFHVNKVIYDRQLDRVTLGFTD